MRMNRRASTAVPIITGVAILLAVIGLVQYQWYWSHPALVPKSFPPVAYASVKVSAKMRDAIQVGDSTALSLTIAAPGGDCVKNSSDQFIPTLLISADQFSASAPAKTAALQCSTTWLWIVAAKTPGKQILSFAIRLKQGNRATAHDFQGPLVAVDVVPSVSLQSWVPWIAALLGAVGTFLSSVGGVAGLVLGPREEKNTADR